uniref:Uncharacterized protein n=1 Tax=Arundo donax TaxID=35708 RepID=A0A0A8YWR2_ARUDO
MNISLYSFSILPRPKKHFSIQFINVNKDSTNKMLIVVSSHLLQ